MRAFLVVLACVLAACPSTPPPDRSVQGGDGGTGTAGSGGAGDAGSGGSGGTAGEGGSGGTLLDPPDPDTLAATRLASEVLVAGEPGTLAVVEVLARAGVLVARDADLAPISGVMETRSAFRYLESQARTMATEIRVGAGRTGAALDRVVPGIPLDGLQGARAGATLPPSLLVAAWVLDAPTFGAHFSRALLGDFAATDHATLRYPWLVLALFAADLGPRLGDGPPPFGIVDVCAEVQDFLDGLGDDVAQALSPQGASVLAGIGRAVAAGLGVAVDAATSWLTGLVRNIPVIRTLRTVLATASLLTRAGSLLPPWVVTVTSAPDPHAYGVDRRLPGTFTAGVGGDLEFEWPEALESCADLLDLELPEPDGAEGKQVTWEKAAGFEVHGFADLAACDPDLDETGSADCPYETASESAEQARGDELHDPLAIRATVVRFDDALLHDLLGATGLGAVADFLPAGSADALAGTLQPSGEGLVMVTHHEPQAASSQVHVDGDGADIDVRVHGCSGAIGPWEGTFEVTGAGSGGIAIAWTFTEETRTATLSGSFPLVGLPAVTIYDISAVTVTLGGTDEAPELIWGGGVRITVDGHPAGGSIGGSSSVVRGPVAECG